MTKPTNLSLADELSEATRKDGRLDEKVLGNVIKPITYSLTPDDDLLNSESDTERHTPEKDLKNSDTAHPEASNLNEKYSSSSSTTSSLRDSISPPPLCPISSSYFSSDVENDHDESPTIESNGAETSTGNDKVVPQQPWLQHIPKHYSLDYDFSDDWDLVIAGTTAATGIHIQKRKKGILSSRKLHFFRKHTKLQI